MGLAMRSFAGLDEMKGDAAVIMMADESDDCRDVVRYWQTLNEGYDCVFGSRFMKGGGVIDYPRIKLILNRIANLFLENPVQYPPERHDQRFQSLPQNRDRRLPAAHLAALQSYRRVAAQSDRARLHLDGDSDHLAEPTARSRETQDSQKWAAGICSSAFTSGWKNILAAGITKKVTANSAGELQKIYGARFAENLAYRKKIWRVLLQSFFQKYIRRTKPCWISAAVTANSSTPFSVARNSRWISILMHHVISTRRCDFWNRIAQCHGVWKTAR